MVSVDIHVTPWILWKEINEMNETCSFVTHIPPDSPSKFLAHSLFITCQSVTWSSSSELPCHDAMVLGLGNEVSSVTRYIVPFMRMAESIMVNPAPTFVVNQLTEGQSSPGICWRTLVLGASFPHHCIALLTLS